MNSISLEQQDLKANLQISEMINDDLIKKDYNPSDNSTYSDNMPSDTNKRSKSTPDPNPKSYSKVEEININDQTVILDFDKVLNVLYEKSPGKRSQGKPKQYLCKKTMRHSSEPKNKRIKVKKKKKKKLIDNNEDEDENEVKDKIKKYKPNNRNLYNIDNFISNTIKIVEKKEFVHIECPKFKEILEDNDDDNMIIDLSDDDNKEEDISDERYIKIHIKYEQNEIDKRMNAFGDLREKKKKNNDKEKHKEKQIKKIQFSHCNSTIEKFSSQKDS